VEGATDLLLSLVTGDHTRSIQIATPTVGGLMKFAVKTATCLGCRTPLKDTNSRKSRLIPKKNWVSHSDIPQMGLSATIVDPALASCTKSKWVKHPGGRSLTRVCGHNVNAAKAPCIRFVAIDRAAGGGYSHSLVQDVLCTSKDCPIFYMRKKAQKDVADAVSTMDRFSDESW
jgi:DNA polymerase delta subunit 1